MAGRDTPGLSQAERRRRAEAAGAALDAAIDRIRARLGYEALFAPVAFADIAAAVEPDRPLAYLATTEAGSLILLLHGDGERVVTEAIWADLTADELERLQVRRAVEQGNVGAVAGGLLPAQVTGIDLASELDLALPQLGERLMAPLAARLRALALERVTLIPGGRLNLLPLPVATYEVDGKCRAFLDEFAAAYAPSAQSAAECRARAGFDATAATILSVGNPLPLPPGVRSLSHARDEAEAVATLFPGRATPLFGTDATLPAVLAGLEGRTFLHFACHGFFDPTDPLASGLLFAGGETLTLAAIRDLPLGGTRLAALSACQTALTDFRELPDEVVGLPAGFLGAGAPGVVAGLWPVDDRSTALLMERFYRHLLEDGLEPAAALGAAQRWLRDATRDELGAYYKSFLRMGEDAAEKGHHAMKTAGNSDEKPYASPAYWAAFTFHGA